MKKYIKRKAEIPHCFNCGGTSFVNGVCQRCGASSC